jgi:predicted nucleic acid-binding protein
VSIEDATIALRRETVFRRLERVDLVDVDRLVLARAAQPLPTELGTLDVIHLATALPWRERFPTDLVMATHDAALAMGARACRIRVVGV